MLTLPSGHRGVGFAGVFRSRAPISTGEPSCRMGGRACCARPCDASTSNTKEQIAPTCLDAVSIRLASEPDCVGRHAA